jgi:hypothetical protein
LGFCKQTAPGPQADLGPGDLAQIYLSRCAAGWNPKTIRMAHFSAHLLDSPAKCRDRIQSYARVAATFLATFNIGCLHAGGLTSEARCSSSRTRSGIRIGNELRRTSVSASKSSTGGRVKTSLIDKKGAKTRTRDLCRDSFPHASQQPAAEDVVVPID